MSIPGRDAPLLGRPSKHRNSLPPVSILKKRKLLEDENREPVDDESENRFEISVISRRTSCCGTLVSIEYISDWLDESSADSHCPSCMAPCTFEPSTRLIVSPAPRQSLRSERSLSPRSFLHQQYTKPMPPLSASLPLPTPTPHSLADPTYRLFNTDDEAYPETEHTIALGSSLISTDIYEVFMRVTSIATLTLLLFALLS